MKNKYTALTVGILASLIITPFVQALEVDREVLPRITLGGRVIPTLDLNNLDSQNDDDEEINSNDSALLARFDKRLYGKGVAGAVAGFYKSEGDIESQQLHAFYWNRNFEVKLGRTRLPNTITELPTLRDDDLLTYTHVGNGSSNSEFDQLFGEIMSFDWFIDQKNQALQAWTGTRLNDSNSDGPDGFDSYGAGYRYVINEDLQYVKRLRLAAISAEKQQVKTASGTDWMWAVIAGTEFNITMNPEFNWSTGLQIIANDGIDDVTSLATVAERAQAKSRSYVASIRYTARPRLLTRWQAALTIAYKDYSDFSDSTQFSVIPSVVYRLGQGVDLLAQLERTEYDDGLFDGATDNRIQVGIAFSFDATFNNTVGERNSILNLEHGYID